MTFTNQTNRVSATGTGSTGQEIPFLFPIIDTSDLTIYKLVTATGVQTNLDETTNYTVTISGDAGGTVTTVTTIETTEQIHVVRNTPFTQQLDLEQGGSFNAENIEDALDKNTKLNIENKDRFDNKAILFPETDSSSLTNVLPSSVDRASKNMTFDSSGNVTASDSVATGSVSFTTFGENMVGSANALAGKVVINLDHVFDVRDYGAVGDGTTDDRSAIQDAIDAASTANGVVFFPMPTTSYFINAALVPKSNVIYRGVEGSKILFTGINAFDASTAITNVTWENLIFDGQSGASKAIVINVATSTYIKIQDCEITGCGTTGVVGDPITITAATHIWVLNNSIHDNRRAITITNCDNIIVSGNLIDEIGPGIADGEIGILIWGNAGATGNSDVKYVTISDNVIRGMSDNGIKVISQGLVSATSGTVKYVSITGNVVEDPGQDGIRYTASHISVVGNVIIDAGISAIRANGGDNQVIANNTCVLETTRSTPISAGITQSLSFSQSSCSELSITGNVIVGDEWRLGIFVSGNLAASTTGQGLVVANNTLVDVGTNTTSSSTAIAGITVNRWLDVSITGNRLDNTYEGISCQTVADLAIKENFVVNCTGGSGRGIRTDAVTRAVVSDNFLNNNTKNYELDTDDTRLVEPLITADFVCNENQSVCNDNQIVINV